ncbi:hypothetical protein [Kribbella sindirgiensis]|uniref:MarR family transcriptional regulator n=1 Tax=Kribbella sindirgiensis TaxID=1124744 RepID=A0A4R0I503_9ACTN|nr:hypothetical protein [Kribbella sindirgiensis]TCC19933.1 hypothetical protein E0H50_37520 [Kribbella sindirgiensis]
MTLTEKAGVVLKALADEGPQTVDKFVTRRQAYVNSWAPTFTALRKAGLVQRTGKQEATSHGAKAHVIELTGKGRYEVRRAAA